MRRLLPFLLAVVLASPLGIANPLQDDAGSGRDAPRTLVDDVRIEPGRVYEGTLTGVGTDSRDVYSFAAAAGQLLEVRFAGALGCYHVYDPSGVEMDFSCSLGYMELSGLALTITETGIWFVDYSYLQPDRYFFSIGLDGPAPSPLPVDVGLFGSSDPTGLPAVAPADATAPYVVVAVVDTGINPYHEFFRAPALQAHPSQWIGGFPADAETIALSFEHDSIAAALEADAAEWAAVATTTYSPQLDDFDTRLYTFPGTRIVGAVSLGEYRAALSPSATYRSVYDDHGHGTHSAGLVAGADLSAAEGNVLIVAVEVGQGQFEEGIRWAARQPWIDAISVSLGTLGNVPYPGTFMGSMGADDSTYDAYLSGKPVFIASGNGFSSTGLGPDRCSTYFSEYTGPAWVTRVGAAEGDAASRWHCTPVDAIARTNRLSPNTNSLTEVGVATGTSAATPNLAGHWAHLALEARRAGETEERLKVLEHLLHATSPPPAENPATPATAVAAERGFGLVEESAVVGALATLAQDAPQPRPELEAWFAADRALRERLWGPGALSDGPGDAFLGQDDAGSGRDAPGTRANAVPVEPGIVYEGRITGIIGDSKDFYAFEGSSGQTLDLQVSGTVGCFRVYRPDGSQLASSCAVGRAIGGLSATLDADGVWAIDYGYFTPDAYAFALGLDAPAPSPLLSPLAPLGPLPPQG